jgi:hypothetical protein
VKPESFVYPARAGGSPTAPRHIQKPLLGFWPLFGKTGGNWHVGSFKLRQSDLNDLEKDMLDWMQLATVVRQAGMSNLLRLVAINHNLIEDMETCQRI